MQILRTAETVGRITQHQGLNKLTRSQGWIRDMELTQTYIDAVRTEAVGQLGALIDAVQVKDGAGGWRKVGMAIFNLDNPLMTRDVIREVFRQADGHTGNTVAKQAAQAWLDTIEGLRVRFNGEAPDFLNLAAAWRAFGLTLYLRQPLGPKDDNGNPTLCWSSDGATCGPAYLDLIGVIA